MLAKLIKLVKVSNFGSVGDGSYKGNVGKIGKVGNFGAIGDGSVKGNIGKISNFGAVGDGSDKGNVGNVGKIGKVWNGNQRLRGWEIPALVPPHHLHKSLMYK